MPHYRITITDIYGKVKQGVRFDNLTDIDAFYNKAHRKAILALKNTFKSIEVVMLSSGSEEVLEFLHKRRHAPQPPVGNAVYHGKQKYDAYNKGTEEQ